MGISLVTTADSGYAMSAWTKSFGSGGYDGYLIKTDKDGNTLWSKVFGGTSDDYFYKMIKTSDNGFIACGQTKSFGNPAGDAWLVKIDAAGSLQWAKRYGDGNIYGDIAIDVIQLSDGGYAFCGVHRFSPGQSQSWVVRTNSLGVVTWSKQFGNAGSDECWGVLEDGNYLLVAGFYQASSYYDGYIMKLDKSNGTMVWIKGYDAENRSTRNEKLYRTTNGYQLFSYLLDDYSDTNQQSVVWNLGLDGTVQNVRKTVIPGIKSSSMAWYPAMDGGFTIVNSEANNNNADLILAKVNSSGTVAWSKKFPITGKQFSGSSVEPTLEAGWAVYAVSTSVANLADSNNLLLIKVDNVGNSGSCPASNTNDLAVVNPTYTNPTPDVVALGDVVNSGPVISSLGAPSTATTNTICFSCMQPPQIINSYTPVTALNPCDNKITVEDAGSFGAGDTVLMIQMKGAVIDSSNSSTFGTVTDYKNAGNYEFNVVKSKSGNIIELKNSLLRQYDIPNGKVQLVSVPYFQNFTVNSTLTSLPWDGNKGGVLVLNVQDTLTLNANIDASGNGFRGGNDPFTNPGSFYCYENQFYYPPNADLASEKGESYSIISASKSFGKGRLGNSGGGGNSHNSGGGGGGNAGDGGLGGYQYEGSPCNTTVPFDNRGIGGKGTTYSNSANKIYLGGGGGAGQSNNITAFESKGGAGGGIIIIQSDKLKSNFYKIISNGNAGLSCGTTGSECHEGMGGGGAGGTVLLKINNYLDADTIEVKGGKGANMSASGFLKVGPGGGGGGGVAWFKNPASLPNVYVAANGGANGVCTGYSNDPWGSTTGQNGSTLYNLQIPLDSVLFKHNIDSVRIKDSVTGCQNYDFKGLAYTNANPISSWQWNFGDGGTANTQNTSHSFNAGTYTVKLIVTDVNGCKDSTTMNITTSSLSVNAGPDTSICANSNVLLQASSIGGVQFAWTPAQFLNDSTLLNPTATPTTTITFYLTAFNAQGCSIKDSVIVAVRSANTFTIDPPSSICTNDSIVLHANGGDIYSWSPGTNPNSPSILVFPQSTTSYSVQITDTVCNYSNSLSTTVTVLPSPNIQATKSGDLDCTTEFSQLNATGGTQYFWSPAATLNNPNIANPTASPTVKTMYTVRGTDANGCVNFDTVTVDITSFNKGEYLMPSAFTPNGDGLNDCYGIKYWGVIDELDFSIYNRWGEKVFYTKNPGDCWDGNFKGRKQDSNVFVYLIKAKTSCGEVSRKGTFVLIR